MKILLDEMFEGWHDRLVHMGHETYSVKKLKQEHDLGTDLSVGEYAKQNGMVLVTMDRKGGKNLKAVGIPCISLGDEDLFQALLRNLDGYDVSTEN